MYKIEITAETLAELSGKVLSLASKLMTGTATEGVSAPKAAKVEVAEAAPVDPTPTPKSAPVVEEQASSTTVDTPTSAPASDPEELEVVDLPITAPEVNVRDLVLSVVEKRGRPVMEEILTRFGAAKASMVSPELLPELIDLCNEALAK